MKKQQGTATAAADESETMTEVLRARCFEDHKNLVRRAARALCLDEADVIRIGSTRYASEVLYRQPALNATV